MITFFPIFDVPVFWPILLMYWFVLLFVTMKRQIKHMIKYRYIPFSLGKKVTAHTCSCLITCTDMQMPAACLLIRPAMSRILEPPYASSSMCEMSAAVLFLSQLCLEERLQGCSLPEEQVGMRG